VIDSGYRGEILLHFRTVPGAGRFYQIGDRIGQLVILPLPRVEFEEGELSEPEHGKGGFGSMGT
jgi:dUTP pyrophosphatase